MWKSCLWPARNVTTRQLRALGVASRLRRTYSTPSSSIVKTLTFPDAPSTQHADLASFVAYAKRTGLDEKSTVYVGTHYEYKVAQSLSRYGFLLKRIGGASDHGTDLVGAWTLAPTATALRVLVQCKAGAQRTGPQHIRELEGAFVGAPVGWRGLGVLGLLVGEQPATKGVRDSLARSKWPMVFLSCSRDGFVTQMLWNRAAEQLGLDAYAVSVRRSEGMAEEEVVLLHGGRIVPMEGSA